MEKSVEIVSQDIKLQIEKCFEQVAGKSTSIPYQTVAKAFPSSLHDPRRFDWKVIDRDQLEIWASARNFSVEIDPIRNDKEVEDKRLVRFTKLTCRL
jgi:hypothetical protein